MKIFQNGSCNILHIVDRKPETQEEINLLSKWFPQGIVFRKSNNKVILLSEMKLNNFHWYK